MADYTDDKNCWVKQKDPSPFKLLGNGDIGILLLHGFSGTAREMEPIGEYLNANGITTHSPLLPGHGTTLAEMNRYDWHAWTGAVETAFEELAQKCRRVFVTGFSMGTLLALWIDIQGKPVDGLILYSPALKVADWRIALTPFAKYFISSISKERKSDLKDPDAEQFLGGFVRYPVAAVAELYKLLRYVLRHNRQVTAPSLVVYSVRDLSIHPRSGPLTVQKLSERVPVEAMVLYDSGHAVVVDVEWQKVAAETLRFIKRNA